MTPTQTQPPLQIPIPTGNRRRRRRRPLALLLHARPPPPPTDRPYALSLRPCVRCHSAPLQPCPACAATDCWPLHRSPVAATAASPAGWWVGLYPQPLARFPLLFQLPLSAGLLFPGIGGDGRHRHVRCVGAFAVRFRGGGAGEAGGTPWPCACAGLALAGWRRQNALASDGCGMRRPAAAPQRHYSISVS